MIRYLSVDDLIAITEELGIGPVRDVGLLASAAGRPAATVFGDDAYAGLHEKAAALLESLARNHALADGNERLAWAATLVFLALNGRWVDAPEDDAYDLVVAVSSGREPHTTSAARLAGWTRPR